MIEVRFDVLRVIHVAVVALAVVFPDDFPVRGHIVVDDFGDLRAFEALRPGDAIDRRSRRRRNRADRRRARRRSTRRPAHVGRCSRPSSLLVDILLHAAAGEERAVAGVGPLMVRAHEPPCPAGWCIANLRAAMAADVPQGVDLAVVAADDDQRIVADGEVSSRPAAGFRRCGRRTASRAARWRRARRDRRIRRNRSRRANCSRLGREAIRSAICCLFVNRL